VILPSRREGLLLGSQFLGSASSAVALSVGILLSSAITDSVVMASLVRASGWLATAVFARPLNELTVRRGRATGILAGWILAVVGISSVLTASITGSTATLLIGMVFGGAGSASMLQARFAVAEALPESERAGSLTRFTWAGALGSILGPSVGVAVTTVTPFVPASEFTRSYVIALAMISLGMICVILFAITNRASGRSSILTPSDNSTAANEHLITTTTRARPSIPALGVSLVAVQFVMTGAMTAAPLHLMQTGWGTAEIGLAISFHMAGMYLFAPVFAHLFNRFGAARISVAVGLVLSGLMIMSLFVTSAAADVARLFLIGVAWSGIQIPVTLELTRQASGQDRSALRSQGRVDMSSSIAAGLGIALSGLFLVQVGYAHIQAGYGLLMLVATGYTLFSREKRGSHEE